MPQTAEFVKMPVWDYNTYDFYPFLNFSFVMPIPFFQSRPSRSYGELPHTRGPKRFFKKLLRNRDLLKKLGLLVLAAGALSLIGGTIVVAWVSRDLPSPDRLNERQVAESTKIYDSTGEHLLYEVFQNQKRTLVEMADIAPLAAKATIAIEDKNFYEHNGVRVLSIIRAGVNNLLGHSAGAGGASTITQQLIKNTLVGGEHSYFRKIKEAILAMRLEKKYGKEDILKMYLNEIPYGSTNYGIEAAARSYFHKSARELNLSESATLAAMIQAPSRYLNNLDSLRARRDLVLRLMFEQGYITQQEKTDAQNAAMRIYRTSGIFDAPHFVLYVKQLLADKFGERAVDTGGLKVITSLNYDLQKAAEDIIKEEGDKFAKEANANNAALVAIDPKTGKILAMVGSRDFYNEDIDGQFNVAVLGKRQPGSSLKPFVYAAAWEKGFTPDTVLYDVLVNFDQRDGSKYQPKNYDGKEHGLVTMRKALQGSLNIPAVKTMYLVGVQETIEFAKRFGYTTLSDNAGLSLVLGGSEVNLLEHTDAYATLANNGSYHKPENILKVTDKNGEVLYEWKEEEGIEAIKPELATTVSGVLSDNNARAFIFGTNSYLTLPDRPVAAKTGTTNDYKDAWTMGYIPSLATGVWVGNTKPASMKGGGNALAGRIWNRFMKEAIKNMPVEQFPAPPPNDATKPILRGTDGGIRLSINKNNGKIATSSTPARAIVERVYLPPHDILYYVDRTDPRGPIPLNPGNDPQYANWESSLQDWANRERAAGREISFEEPPTELDDTVQDPALAPNVEIVFPASGSAVNSRALLIQVKAGAPRGVAQVSYELDNKFIGIARSYPFDLEYYARDFATGEHTLRATAEDDEGNAAMAEIRFNLTAPMDPPSFDWVDGDQTIVVKADFPRAMQITPFRWDDIKDIKITLSAAGKPDRLIYTLDHNDKIENGRIMFVWKTYPGDGTYTLHAQMTAKDGRTEKKDLVVEAR